MNNYFTVQELQCPCCKALIMDEMFLTKLNRAREIAGIPIKINSGYRCMNHNTNEGSVTYNHTSGKAADIHCTSALRRYTIVQALLGAGMMGIGIRKNFIHCDANRNVKQLWIN